MNLSELSLTCKGFIGGLTLSFRGHRNISLEGRVILWSFARVLKSRSSLSIDTCTTPSFPLSRSTPLLLSKQGSHYIKHKAPSGPSVFKSFNKTDSGITHIESNHITYQYHLKYIFKMHFNFLALFALGFAALSLAAPAAAPEADADAGKW